ncbi:MAG: hypothetical protein J7494_15315, partial [Sphingobium sp.]|nr:hypothetical protein [Sphingobium sp.]
IAAMTVEQAYRRYVERVDPALSAGDLAPRLIDTTIELGAIYRSHAVASEDDDSVLVEAPEAPSGRPGTRFPHVWLEEGVSTLDLAGDGLVLLAGPDGRDWIMAAASAGLAGHSLSAAARRLAGIEDDGALLLRPDGVIAWRSRHGAPDATTTLSDAIRRIGGR